MKSSCPEAAVRSALIASVRGEASSLVSFVGFNAPLGMILEAMEKRFGKVPTTDRLQQEFFQLQQDKGERVQHFAGRLEKTFKRLQEVFPDRYGEIQLKERLFHGVNQQTRDSMRFLYTKESTTYDSLLAAIKEAESEWNESKSQLRVKSAVVCDREDQMEELKKRLDKLTATVKSSNVKEKPKGNKNKTRETRLVKMKNESCPGDLQLLQLGPLNHHRELSNVINARAGVMAGGSVRQRETWIGGGCGRSPPPSKIQPPKMLNNRT